MIKSFRQSGERLTITTAQFEHQQRGIWARDKRNAKKAAAAEKERLRVLKELLAASEKQLATPK